MIKGFVSLATDKGLRDYQEDRFVIHSIKNTKERGWLLAVMDGHNDSPEVAEFCEKNLPTYFDNLIGSSYSDLTIKNVLRLVVSTLNDETRTKYSGCTLSIVYISETRAKAFISILGDSPVIVKSTKNLWVSPEHNIRTNIKDRKAVINKGARYSAGYMCDSTTGYGLQLTRSLGDVDFDRYLIREPQIFTKTLDKNSFILVATDGLLDPQHKNQKLVIRSLVNIIKNGGTSSDLLADALKRETGDNVTAVLWKQPKG